jgi:hypothetical protein
MKAFEVIMTILFFICAASISEALDGIWEELKKKNK